jgi:uncharacterized protein (TIGR04255 family)
VCGVQFETLSLFSSLHYGEFHQRVKNGYPRTQEKEPLAEVFEGPQGAGLRGEVAAFDMPPLRRVFFIDSTGNFLLQLQPSRFLANWRKEKPTDEYPRFAVAYEKFLKGWEVLLTFLKDSAIGLPEVNQYEMTYINHIPESSSVFPLGIQEHVPMLCWRAAQSSGFLPSAKSAALKLQFSLPDSRGTLHVSIGHGQRLSDRKGVMILDLTARGPAKRDWSDMKDWFEMAHEWIVRGFTDLTSDGSHRLWERER